MRVKFLEIGHPTPSGKIYTEECVIRALAAWKTSMEMNGQETKLMPIFKEPAIKHISEDVVGFVTDVKIEDGYLTGEIGFIEERIKPLMPEGEHINIRPNGVGTFKDNIVQNDYRINGFAIIRKKQST